MLPSNTPLLAVSICIATFNAASDVEHAIQSALSQTGVTYELCIADGGSTDETLDICKRYSDQISVLISEPDHGIYDAWNKLVDRSCGRICFLGADDCFHSTTSLLDLVRVAEEAAPTRLAYGRVRYVDDSGKFLFEQGAPWPASLERLQREMSIPHVGMLQHRTFFNEGVRFDSSLRIAADFKMVRQEGRANGASFLDEIIVTAKFGGISTQPKMEVAHWLENRRVVLEQDGVLSPYWYVRLAKILLRRGLLMLGGPPLLVTYEKLKRLVLPRARRQLI